MANLEKLRENLIKRGFDVTILDSSKQAAEYLNEKIHQRSVGISGSVTLQNMQTKYHLAEKLSAHNTLFWHWYNRVNVLQAMRTEVYITSVNGVAETGELVNIESRGNRISSTICGHDELYFVIGVNKIVPTYEEALWRAKNVAAPKKAQSMKKKTPCAKEGDKCYDCQCPDRICKVQVTHWMKSDFIGRAEVIIIKEEIGY